MGIGDDVAYVNEVSDRLFVTIAGRYHDGGKNPDQERFPIAFIVPMGTPSSAKRIETARDWSKWTEYVSTGERYTTSTGAVHEKQKAVRHAGFEMEIDNEWLGGFEFDSVVSRYTTDNKVFRVQDPRGFSAEIYSDCMMRVLRTSTIKKGVIVERCKWGRANGKIFLLIEGSPEHEEYEKMVSLKKLGIQPGDVVALGAGMDNINYYVGDYYAARVTFDYLDDAKLGIYRGRTRHHWSQTTSRYEYHMETKVSEIKKPWHVMVNAGDDVKAPTLKREWAKNDRTIEKAPDRLAEKIGEIQFGVPFNTWSYNRDDVFTPGSDFTIVFKTKEEFEAWIAKNKAENYQTIKDEYSRKNTNHNYSYIMH